MMRSKIYILAIVIISFSVFAETGIDDFTRVSVDPFIEGAGGAYAGGSHLRLYRSISASNFNPANLSGERSLMMSHSSIFDNLYIADFAAYNSQLSAKIDWGVSALITGGDGIYTTALPDESDTIGTDNRPFITGEKSHYDFLLTPAASYRVNDKLSAGLNARLFYRKLVDENAFGGGLSAGLRYKMSDMLNLGFYVRNLTTMPVIWSTGTNEIALPSLRFGGAWSIYENGSSIIELCADGEYSVGDELFGYGGGIRAQIADHFAINAGYSDLGFSAGAAAMFKGVGVAASYSEQSDLQSSYRIALFYRWVR